MTIPHQWRLIVGLLIASPLPRRGSRSHATLLETPCLRRRAQPFASSLGEPIPGTMILFSSISGRAKRSGGGDVMMQSYPARALDRRLQEDWAKDAREGPRVLMSLRIDFGPMG